MSAAAKTRNPYQNRTELLQGTVDTLILKTLSERKATDSNQRATYYRIPATGKKQVASNHSRWRQMVEAIGAIMNGETEGGEP
jgi:hypothetical protein